MSDDSTKYVCVDVDGWIADDTDKTATEFYIGGETDDDGDFTTDPDLTFWVPKSLVRNLDTYLNGDVDFIEIPEWKAKELNLDYYDAE